MTESEMTQIADWIQRVLDGGGDDGVCTTVRGEVDELCAAFPIYDWRLREMG